MLDLETFRLLYSDGIVNYILKRASRKVTTRLITQFREENATLIQSLEGLIDIRYIPQVAFNTIIIDRQWVLTSSSSAGAFEATMTISQDFASREVIIFEQLWKIARSASSMTYEQLAGTQIVKAVKGVDEATATAMRIPDRATTRCMMVFATDGYVSLNWLLKHRPQYVDMYKMTIFKTIKRGVNWRLVAAGSLQNMDEVSDLASIMEIRALPKTTTQFIISENEVILHPPNVANVPPEEAMFFWSDHEAMVEALWGIGDNIWASASPVPIPTVALPKPSLEEETKAKPG